MQEDDSEIEDGDQQECSTKDSWPLSGDLIYRHREEPRLKLYGPVNETFPIPFKYVDVMRQTHTNVDHVSENVINDNWIETKNVNLSEDWTGTTRSQILRTRFLEGCEWVKRRPSKIQKTTRPDSIRREAWIRLSEKQKQEDIAP